MNVVPVNSLGVSIGKKMRENIFRLSWKMRITHQIATMAVKCGETLLFLI